MYDKYVVCINTPILVIEEVIGMMYVQFPSE